MDGFAASEAAVMVVHSAEKAAAAKAKILAKEKAEKELLKAISKSGLSLDAVKEKLGI